MSGFDKLLRLAEGLRFRPYSRHGDPFSSVPTSIRPVGDIPITINLLAATSHYHQTGPHWQDQLEFFLSLDGEVQIPLGEEMLRLGPGDLLCVGHLNKYTIKDLPERRTRLIEIRFLPEWIVDPVSTGSDYGYLLPFYGRSTSGSAIMAGSDPAASPVYEAIVGLLSCFATRRDPLHVACGTRAWLTVLLHHLGVIFQPSEISRLEYLKNRHRMERLKPVFEYIGAHYLERIPVTFAAAMVRLSVAQFVKLFKQVAGMTFVAYLNHVRLAHAVLCLYQNGRSIAQVAAEAGFADQSYFDRRFKRTFGVSPRQYRSRLQLDTQLALPLT